MCLKKKFKSPQWLRNLKFKKYPLWRIDKTRNIQVINNGGWHFAYLQSPENISKKIKSFAHGEFNKDEFINIKKIEERIKNNKDIFNRGFNLKKINIDESFPDYIFKNQHIFKDWIA